MEIEQQTVGDIIVLACAGEFDGASHPETIKRIDGFIEGFDRVVFNFSKLTFINSSALGYLIKTAEVLKEAGGELVFSEPAENFRKIVEVYDVGAVFPLYASDQAALAHFGATR